LSSIILKKCLATRFFSRQKTPVMPAHAGISAGKPVERHGYQEIPAFAGMTDEIFKWRRVTVPDAGK
jgi:hypothetical protein